MDNQSSIFHRLADVVKLRYIQRPFAFVWDVDLDGNEERDLLARYVATCGALSREPVLLTARYAIDTPMQEGWGQPFGVYFPEKAIATCFADGKIDLGRLEDEDNQGGSLDDGICKRTLETSPRCIAAADTSLLDFISNLSTDFHRCTLVLDGNRWSGVVTPDDLMSPPARMCLLAMVLELESAAAQLCRLFAVECIKSLPEQRRQKALEAAKHRFDPATIAQSTLAGNAHRLKLYSGGKNYHDAVADTVALLLIDSTNLTDKARMVCKCKLTIDLSNNAVRSVFGRAERLRNQCAHPGLDSDTLPFSVGELVKLVKETTEFTRVFHESFVTEIRGRKIVGPPPVVEKVRFYGGIEVSDRRRPVVIAMAQKQPDKPAVSQFFILLQDKGGTVEFRQTTPMERLAPSDTGLTDEQVAEASCDDALARAKDVIWALDGQGQEKPGTRSLESCDDLDHRLKAIDPRTVLRALLRVWRRARTEINVPRYAVHGAEKSAGG